MIKANKLFLTVLVSAALAACGGGGSTPVTTTTSTSNTTAALTATTSAAVLNKPFSFTSGVAAFGTTTPTTLAFTSSSATPAFAISSGGFTAKGPTKIGSCTFTMEESTFPPDSPLALGKSVTVDPCAFTVVTSGANANGAAANLVVQFVLGTLNSQPETLSVVVNSNGTVVINNVGVGTVTISVVTGT